MTLTSDSVRLLTVRQPWASLIMSGAKTIENRSWSTAYRGRLGIIAGLSRASLRWADELSDLINVPADLPRGCLLGTVELLDIIPFSSELAREHLFAEGPYCWILRDPRPLPRPIPMRGSLSLSRALTLAAICRPSLSA